jgi:hypothetical protein
MKLYHGSTEIIDSPEIIDSQRFLDFGKGFYCTSEKTQAESWSKIKQKREGKNSFAFVSVFDFDEKLLTASNLKIKAFNEANKDWLEFVILNRNGKTTHNFDIVKGPVANDTLYAVLSLYETGILTQAETIIRLKTHKLFDQISFHTHPALQCLVFFESYSLA